MAKPTVILLHGLGRSQWAMRPVARYLAQQGYPVCNVGYPSQRFDIRQLTERYIAPAFARLPRDVPTYWVTHSLGSILLRCFASQVADTEARSRLQRVVMLAPPNQGSELVDHLRRWPMLPGLMGPAFLQLGTDDGAYWRQVAASEAARPLSWQVGVIAGTRSWEPWFSRLISGANDGKVSVHSACWPGAADTLCLPVNHTTLMRDQRVLKAIDHFFLRGSFPAAEQPEQVQHGH